MKNPIAIGIALLMITTLKAQTSISGNVLTENGDTITGANVFIEDAFDGFSSDRYGYFKFTTNEQGNKILKVTMLGYESAQKSIFLDGKPLTLKILLVEKVNELNTVVISAGNFETGDLKKMAVLNSIDIVTTAGATADIFGALKSLPGTQPAAESNGLFVRGGDASESKTFFDGLLVHNPFATQLPDIAQRGRFSPFMFKGTSFSTGAYSAQYGEALSSTMSLESKDQSPKTKSDIGMMSVGFDATHVQRFKNSSLDLNGSYYNLKPVFELVKQNTEWTKTPESIHANSFYKLNTGSSGLLKIHCNYEHSTIGIISSDFRDVSKDVSYNVTGDNLYLNSTWQQFVSDQWKINVGAGFGNDYHKIKIDTNLARQKETSLHTKAFVTHYFGKYTDVKAGIDYFSFTNDESFNEKQHQLTNPIVASFFETNYYITRQLAIRLGARHEYASSIHACNFAPRISLAYKWNNVSQVSFGFGEFYQIPPDEYLFNSKTIGFEKSTHYLFNYQYQQDKRTFRAEAYYKTYSNLVKTNNSDPSGLDNSGYGYAKGFDVFYRDSKSLRSADYWISYSFLDTKRNYRDFPIEATPAFAANHVANFVAKYFISVISTSIGATYTYASGRSYFNPNSQVFLSDKTKDYHNISLNVSYLTSVSKHFTIVYLSVENIFGISHVYGYRYSPDGTFRKPIVPSAPRGIFIGVFITLGDNIYR